MLDQVQLSKRADARPSQLSGGMQQRVALARALVNEPEVLLLDEPLGALDLKLRQAMQVELKDLQGRVGITFIYVTHDQEEALTMSDRIGVMNDGSLLQVGRSEEIYEHPTSRFVADFIGEINLIDVTMNGSDASPPLQRRRDRSSPEAPPARRLRSRLPCGRSGLLSTTSTRRFLPDYNRIRVRVTRRLYYGDVHFYDVDAGIGTEIEVKEENRPGVELYEVGEEAYLVWSPEAARLVTS